MSSRNPERRRQVNREFYRFHRGLAVDAALEAATFFLSVPKTASRLSPRKCIAYCRVYSETPPHPDYGHKAQREAVERVVGRAGATLIDEYDETEKRGRRNSKRHQLSNALRTCQVRGAWLIIAKLGQLVHSAPILSELAASGVNFICLDWPDVNHDKIETLAIAAQRKEKARTAHRQAAWAALKAKGYRHAHMTPENAKRYAVIMTEAVRAKSRTFLAERLVAHLEVARRNGWTLTKTAEKLNDLGITTPRGHTWDMKSVHRAKTRAKALGLMPSETQIALATKLMEAAAAEQVEPSPATSAPAAPVSNRSGFKGKPTSRDVLVKPEFMRRWAASERHPSRKHGDGESALAWAKILSAWLAEKYPDRPQMGVSAARDVIADWLRELAQPRSMAA
jgi:DNA invertase Pin-like site-specific DNA recombinase